MKGEGTNNYLNNGVHYTVGSVSHRQPTGSADTTITGVRS